MTFAWPNLLWLVALPIGMLIWELLGRRRGKSDTSHPKILRAEIAGGELSVTRDPARLRATRARPWLALGLTFAIAAVARPQWGRVDEPVFDQSREILIAIDLSRSMMSPDVKPSRLDRAKLLVQALLEKLKGERVGLVVFSGTAFLQSPLSSDYEILREFLPALNPDFLPKGGTNYRAMIDTTVEAFGTGTAADRFLIVLSDGEATDDSWQSAADQLRDKGVHVIALGIGTAAGSMIPDGSGGFVKDERGAVVLSKLESGTLQQLARNTHGVYRDASSWLDLSSLIDETVNAARKGDFVDKNTVRLVERFQWPLAFALWCLLVSAYYEFPVQPRPRALRLRSRATPAMTTPPASGVATVALAFAMVMLALGRPSAVMAAVKKPSIGTEPPTESAASATNPADAPGTPAAMGKIVSRLSQKSSLTAPDLSEFAHETLSWGRRLKDAGQPVPDGPVADALEAVDRLIASGDKLANWQQLRADLEALRQEDERKKQQPQQQQQQQQNKDKSQDQKQSKEQNQSQDQKDPRQNDAQKQSGSPSKPDEKSSPEQQQQSQPRSSPAQPQNSAQRDQSKAEQKPDQPFAFGDMKQQQPPPPSKETQKVGGAQEKKDAPPADPALAVPMEKLDQLRNQDSPARLFELMQSDRSHGKQQPNGKNW